MKRRRGKTIWQRILALAAVVSLLVFAAYQLPEDKAADKIIIGVSINSLRSPFMVALNQGIRQGAEAAGVELLVLDCNGDLVTQAAQIKDFVQQKVDGILMEPLDPNALGEVVGLAGESGIPVYCVDTSISQGADCIVGSDNIVMGQTAARYIAEALKARYGEYRGKVVNLMASINTTSGRDRSRGFHQIIDNYPDIEIVSEQNGDLVLDTAVYTTNNILQANQEIDAIWCSGDTNANGAMQAMRWQDRLIPAGEEGHIILISADGASESLEAIKQGYMDACISQNPIQMGEIAVALLARQIREGEEPAPSFLAYPLYVVTRDNVGSENFRQYGIWSEEIES